jgi:DNA-directed RNA polymerase specialized sigma24 family protein
VDSGTSAGTDAGFAAFVADRRPALLRTALLLTGDRSTAEELVQRALTRSRRARQGDPEEAARQALVDGAVSRWARFAHAEQVIESLPDPFAAPGPRRPPTAEPDLAAALRELAPRTRAVVVLRWHDGLPDALIARLLRCPAGTVAAEAARGLAQLQPALAPSAYERATTDVPVEQRLADRLARLAAASVPWRLDAGQALADVRARRSTSRRRLTTGAATGLCLVALAAPLARRAPDPAPRPVAAPVVAAPATPTSTVPPVPVLAGPTRGSLAGDPAFLDAVRTVDWGGQEPPPAADRAVVFAADTPQGRVALVVGNVFDDFRGVWLTGPVGAAARDLEPHLPRQLGRDRPLALLLGGPGPASLVVVAAPGDEIAVSDRLMTGPLGTVGRSYVAVDAVDGVAVVPARTTSGGSAVSVRVTRDGREVYRSAADWLGVRTERSAPPPELSPLRPGATPDPYLVAAALTELAVPLGVEPGALQPQLLWSAELPLTRGTGTVVVLVGHSPGGALAVTTWAGVGNGAVPCGTQTPPGTTEVATLTVARVCDVSLPGLGQTDDGRWLVVTAPPAASSAELLDARGRVLGPLGLTGGGAVVPLPDHARSVRTFDADGHALLETPIAPSPVVPFGDFGPGPEG